MPILESPVSSRIEAAVEERFGTRLGVDADLPGLDEIARIVEHRSHRRYTARTVEPALLRILFACALSAPSKSDLQQADIIHVADRAKVDAIAALIPDMPWIAEAPVVLVFCGNHRRIHQIAEWRRIPFANDHLDHFMNAAVDAAIVMTTFIRAAEAVGLGTCPISAVRNKPREVSALLELPERVFPMAGLTLGYPAQEGRITPRLPLEVTVHTGRFDDSRVREHVDAYDARRDRLLPYRNVRRKEQYGTPALYGWSEDKARQYSTPERADFGAFIRQKKFNLA
jgi:nitroreductase/FMN reductase [NAD(P)H]